MSRDPLARCRQTADANGSLIAGHELRPGAAQSTGY
jgi:hypothetical protein